MYNIYLITLEQKLRKIKITPYTKHLINFNSFILFAFSLAFYIKSLQGCSYAFYRCLWGKGYAFFESKKDECVFASLAATSLFFCAIHKYITRTILIPIITIYPIMFYFNQGNDLRKHGNYNTFVFCLTFIILYSFLEYSYWVFNLCTKGQFKKGFILASIVLLPFIYFIIVSLYSCRTWTQGLSGVRIDNSKQYNSCKIREPKFCTIETLDNIFDLSKYLIKTCKNTRNKKEFLLPYLKGRENFTNYAYPDTSKYTFRHQSFLGSFHSLVLEGIYNADDPGKKIPEVIVSYDKDGLVEISMKITPNETLIKERREISKKNKVKFENVLIIYIDAISRNHFLRKLKKTSKVINEYIIDNKNKKPKYNSFQFMKYSNFRGSTFENVKPMLYGVPGTADGGILLTKYYKEKGFITMASDNLCSREVFDIQEYCTTNMHYEASDHENFALFCDINYSTLSSRFGQFHGQYSLLRRCLYGRDTFEYVYDYADLFWDAYPNERKFARISFIDAHEGTLEVIKYMDNYLEKFLKNFIHFKMNDNTALFIVSDHGENMVSLHHYLKGSEFKYETTLGTFFLILPENNKLYNYNVDNIRINQQRFITPYDIHDTLINILFDECDYYSGSGQTLFQKVDGLKRSCANYPKDFDNMERYCSCISH